MKNQILSAIAMATIFMACNSSNTTSDKKSQTEANVAATDEQLYSCSMHPEVTGKKGETCSKCGMELTEPVKQTEATHQHTDGEKHDGTTKEETETTSETIQSEFSINDIISNYLSLKNALVKDDTKTAATAGNLLYAAFKKINTSALDSKKKAEYLDIAESAKEHAEHIGSNSGKLDHQREHFVLLSKDVSDLISTFGTKQKLYQDFCPMADGGKGAIWVSESKEIKNPYYGSKMLTCGSVKKTF